MARSACRDLAARIDARRGDASDATAAVLRRQVAYDLGRIEWHRIDAGRPAATVIDEARRISTRELDARNQRDS
jgi:hypothetical protein